MAILNRKRLRSQRGMSLVEILVAAFVFAIVVVALVEFYYWGRARIMEVGLRRSGLAQAQEKMEELRTATFYGSDLTIGTHGPETVQVGENLSASRSWAVSWKDDVANGYSGAEEDCKEVVVTVAWSWQHIDSDQASLTGLFYP